MDNVELIRRLVGYFIEKGEEGFLPMEIGSHDPPKRNDEDVEEFWTNAPIPDSRAPNSVMPALVAAVDSGVLSGRLSGHYDVNHRYSYKVTIYGVTLQGYRFVREKPPTEEPH